MPIRKAFLCLLSWLAACTPTSERVDDYRQHVQLLWRKPSFAWITSSLLIKDNLLYFGSFNHAFCAAELPTGKLKLAFRTGGDSYYPPTLAKNRGYNSYVSFTTNFSLAPRFLYQGSIDGCPHYASNMPL